MLRSFKKSFLFVWVLCSSFESFTQSFVEIPRVKSYKLIASATNGGPTLTSGDKFGRAIASIGDINGDGIGDVAVGSNEDAGGGTLRGSVWICFMNTDGTVKSSPAPVEITGTAVGCANSDFFGTSVAGIGDLNSDGYKDIVVGAPGSDITGNTDCGAIYIVFLNASAGLVGTPYKITKGTTGFGTSLGASSGFGSSVTNLGDINNDQKTDIAVGAYGHDGTQGAVFTIRLKSTGAIKLFTEIKEGSGITAGALDANDNLGWSVVGAGDLNYDNKKDLIVGAKGDDDGYIDAGAFYVLYLDTAGAVLNIKKIGYPLMSNYYFPFTTTVSFGESIGITDINEDGIMDIIAGVKTFNSSKGGVCFMTMDSTQNITRIETTGFNYNWNYAGPATAPQFGISVCELNLGLKNNKQYVVGANFHNGGTANQGSFYTITMDSLSFNYPEGTNNGYVKLDDFSGNFTGTINNSDFFGIDIAAIGDLNNDGNKDYIVGAHGNDDGFTDAGAAWVLFMDSQGKVSSSSEIVNNTANFVTLGATHNLGWGLCPAGDFDKDGVEDFFVGAPGDDQGGTDRGAVYLVYMNSNGTVKGNVKIANSTNLTLGNTDRFGVDIDTIGDLDNNGVVDIVVGAYQNDDGGTNRGAAYVVFLKANGSIKKSKRISNSSGSFSETFADNDIFGIGVAGIGDINNDGKEDIAVGSNMNGTGAVHIIMLDTTGSCTSFKKINNAVSNFPYTLTSGQSFGFNVESIPDIDGNGIRDIVIGQGNRKSYGIDRGGFWITSLDAAGNVLSAKLLSDSSGCFYTNTNASYTFGQSIEYGGLDSKGNFILAFGSRDDAGGTDRGGVFIGGLSTFFSLVGSYWQPVFVELEKKLDGEYYKFADKMVRFRYYDKYNDDDNKLSFNIYNGVGVVVYTDASLTLNPNYGENRFVINCGPSGANLPWGSYILEVINTKKEKYYLRFDLVNPSSIK